MVCLGLARGQQVTSLEAPARASWNVPGVQFAIADLDGDRRPDLASVEEERLANSTKYAIRLQFGAGVDAYIGVNGPLGGVRLTIRDVNGDDSLDLVLTSVIDRRVIQVLLNDGHGNFSPAEPGAYAVGLGESERFWSEREPSREDGGGPTSSRWSFDAGRFGAALGNAEPGAAFKIAELAVRVAGHTRLCHGRAPPRN